MAVKDALLALLADGPCYGYELKSAFDTATGKNWPVNIGQVYSTLQRLERDNLITAAGQPDQDGRQSYQLTAVGRESLRSWYDTPSDPPGVDRDDLSMKVLIAVATDPDHARELVIREQVAAMGHLQALTAQKVQATTADLATRLQLDRTVMLADAQVRWLNLVEQRLEQRLEQHVEPDTTRVANPATAAELKDSRR